MKGRLVSIHVWPRRFAALALLFAALLAVGVACGDEDGGTDAPEAPAASSTSAAISTPALPPLSGKVTVFAASSLTESFKIIGEAFTKMNPGVRVEFNFASSSALATQIEQGAPADVFASADDAQMQRLMSKALIESQPSTFARNVPVIVIPSNNQANIMNPKDLANAGVKIVLAAPDVPIGNYARQIIDKLAADTSYGAGFKDAALKNVVSNEANVRAVLTKVELGEADAGIVYRTDALISKEKVKSIPIPDSANVVATYPIAVVRDAKDREAAAAFVEYARGASGQAILAAAGFESGR